MTHLLLRTSSQRSSRFAGSFSIGSRSTGSLPIASSLALLLMIIATDLAARTLTVGPDGEYPSLSAAAPDAQPGDEIVIQEGTYPGGEYIEGLAGRQDAWITIRADGDSVLFSGGSQAWHLVEVSYVRIVGFTFAGQGGNGVNIDDGGTFDTPAHHVTIEGCTFRDMNASGNNDLLKLSGLDSFEVRNCAFANGAAGGSGVDMVGCHYGLFEENSFRDMGSNAIQAKGGTQYIVIRRNVFRDCGQRSLNLGGSTGLEFFRPLDAPFEAADLKVHSNIFMGSMAPIAYVGSTRVEVANNTIWKPERWVLRILQETVDESRFIACGDNSFINNLIVIDGALATEVNVGPNTRPESFLFSHNLWYNADDPSWGGPDLPVAEPGQVVADPLFVNGQQHDFRLRPGSPAIGAALEREEPTADYAGIPFGVRDIGALSAQDPSSVGDRMEETPWRLDLR